MGKFLRYFFNVLFFRDLYIIIGIKIGRWGLWVYVLDGSSSLVLES